MKIIKLGRQLCLQIVLCQTPLHDIDMILIIEDRYQEFAAAFWEYIKEGHYRCGWKNNSDMHFYRFTEPNAGYPANM